MQTLTQLAAEQSPATEQSRASGLYAIYYRDNWDGEGDTYHLLAEFKEGKWHAEDSGKELLQYEGDAILRAWPLFEDQPTPATEQSGEAVTWQFYDQGRWHNGNDQVKDHRKNTEAAGIPTRDLYTRPQPAPSLPEGWRETLSDAAELLDRLDCEQTASELRTLHAMLAAAPQPAVAELTIENAPIGTKAPAIMGGYWYRTDRGWKWNGSGGTFPRPGGDWNGDLIAPQPAQQLPSVIEEIAQQWDGCIYDSPSGDIDIGWAIRAAGK
ncbi:hypothetical protein, partial [Chromobacterium violaceum]